VAALSVAFGLDGPAYAVHEGEPLVAPQGRADPERGIRQFVVGTGGGKGTYPILDPIAHSEVHNDDAYGVLKLTLHPGSYEWRFVPAEGGEFTDSGSARCH
jgi:hypothetical protein